MYKKLTSINRRNHKDIRFSSLKNVTVHGHEKAWGEVKFTNYENFDNVNDAYSNFIPNLMEVIHKVTSVKNNKIKINFQ